MDLALQHVIVESDDDLEIWASIVIGFDEDRNLVVRMKYVDYDFPEHNCLRDAVVAPDEAYRLAKQFRLPLVDLPRRLAELFGEDSGLQGPVFVGKLFSRIVGYFNDCGVRCDVLERKSGKTGA